ncbi:RICIN domain-containing protein [Streptomyces liliifuscus]|uniref:RICIN domain-containing protein n=1 Tax=Streptomyces liliifuscus TaxID=2797636 RepID=UPI002D7F57A2|nr:RICIN domain-containing protein [Streptomyces liliifuscus]
MAATLAIGMLAAVSPAPAEAAMVDTNAWYVLVNRNSGKALDLSGASTADGARAGQRTRNDGANQQFRLAFYNTPHSVVARQSGVVQWICRR